MRNTTNLGNDFKERLTDACDKFSRWMKSSNAILEAFNTVKADVETIKELDNTTVEIDKVTDKTADELNTKMEESFSNLENRIISVDTFEIDLKEKGIDVSEWEEPVKPVKVIMSVVTRRGDGEYGLAITMGNMIMLMEDGTFRPSNDEILNAEKLIEELKKPEVKKLIQDVTLGKLSK